MKKSCRKTMAWVWEVLGKSEIEEDAEAKCAVVCTIKTEAECADLKFRNKALNKFDALSHYSYTNRPLDKRKVALISSRLNT